MRLDKVIVERPTVIMLVVLLLPYLSIYFTPSSFLEMYASTKSCRYMVSNLLFAQHIPPISDIERAHFV